MARVYFTESSLPMIERSRSYFWLGTVFVTLVVWYWV
jgi:hypothetical protein